MNADVIAVICGTVVNLALIGSGVWAVHRLSERIRVAAPAKQAQQPAAQEPQP